MENTCLPPYEELIPCPRFKLKGNSLTSKSYPPSLKHTYITRASYLFWVLKRMIDSSYPNTGWEWYVPDHHGLYRPAKGTNADGSKNWLFVSNPSYGSHWSKEDSLSVMRETGSHEGDFYEAMKCLFDPIGDLLFDKKQHVIFLGRVEEPFPCEKADLIFSPSVKVTVKKGSHGPQITFMFLNAPPFDDSEH